MKNIKEGIEKARTIRLNILVMTAIAMVLFVASVPPVSARTVVVHQTITSEYGPTFVVNYDNVSIWLDGNDSTVLKGQVIQFYNRTGGPSGKVILHGVSGEAEDYDPPPTGSDGLLETTLKTGKYEVRCDDPSYGCNVTNITVSSVDLKLKLQKGTKTVSKVAQGTPIRIKFTGLDPKEHDGVTLKVTDPSGNLRTWNIPDGKVFEKVNVSYLTDMELNTTGWELGTWRFKVVTEDEYARGLEAETDEKKLEIVSPELKIVAEKTEIVEREKVKLTVSGVADHPIKVWIERGAKYAKFPPGSADNPPAVSNGTFDDTIDAEGEMEYVVSFNKIGSYTVKVKDLESGTEDFVVITVTEKKVTFYMPKTCAIGSDLVVNGTANIGGTIDLAIKDRIVKVDAAIDKEGKFEVKLPTPDTYGTGTEGAVEIKAFIDGNFSLEQDVSGEDDDGSIMVLMVRGDLTAESSATLVPPGDSFTLSGTAPGSKVVDILIVGPKGGSGRGMSPLNSKDNGLPSGIVYETASVSTKTNTWSIEIDVDEHADSGTYLVFVLSPGKNKIYDGINDGELLNGIKTKYFGGGLSRLAGKTQAQINATLYDATIGAAGSDDFLKKLTIKVGTAEVSLYSIADVELGSDMVVAGTSNREGHPIIVRVTGPINLGTKFATVENGKFKVNFSTSEALTGEYTVEADDGESHVDTTTVNIVTPVRTLASPTPVSVSVPVPTTAPTLTPTTPQEMQAHASTPTTQLENAPTSTSSKHIVPGFKAVFVIAALVVVVVVSVCINKRRR
ncbi:MAG: hypothetical protein OCU17_05620 [Methanophagales archaeon]|nr:hypothetical protein [Methanophagales archaeon]